MKHLLVAALCLRALSAQTTDASVSGTVTDPAGANIPGASVVALQSQTGVAFRTSSNASGVFVFPALPPGKYSVTGQHTGFRKAVLSDIELEIGAKLTFNIQLEIGQTSETVEVQAAAGELNYSTSSIGSVVSGRKVLELPLAGRDAYDLISTQAGVVGTNVNGNRTGSLNITMDGVTSTDNLLNGMFYVNVANTVSVDRAEEFRIITSPVDAELGRGSAQVQILSRSGTNQFHGSVWEEIRNTSLTANTFFNNARGVDAISGQQVSPRDVLIRNQYGGRLGGPIVKNRTFFNGNYEGYRNRQRNSTTATVPTDTGRRGLYRFFPGAQNANANASAALATVDLQGNPVRPPSAVDALQTINLFGRDPNRLVADPTGTIAKQLSLIPLPNNFRAGDGLNTAGFTWSRPLHYDFEYYEMRVDHMFSPAHRMSASFNHQAYASLNVAGPQAFPASPGGLGPTETTQYNATLTSVLRPNVLNEFRAGVFRPRTEVVAPYDEKAGGNSVMPRAADQAYLISFATFTSPLYNALGSDPSNRLSPVYQLSDNLSWLRGKHAFKGGFDARLISSAGYDAFAVQPRAAIGAGFVPVANINSIPGIGQNTGGAQGLLLDLTGSLGNAFQVYNSPGGTNPVYLSGLTRYRNWSQHEYSFFFKDEYKIRPSFTLNIGVRYEWYAVPHERQGKGLAPVGGGAGSFGISGTTFGDLFQPGLAKGSLTQVQLIGPRTPNPDTKFFGDDYNNFAPSVGFAWSLPWFGKNKTIMRAGYGMGYERNPIYLVHNVSGLEPGLSETAILLQASNLNVANLKLPVQPAGAPLAPVPVTARTQTLTAFDKGLRTPYIQNWNFTLTRSLSQNTWLDVRYAGTKGTKLIREANVNEVNIVENGILDAYRVTQAGGNAPLLNRIFTGLSGVNGTTITGSDLIRSNTSTQGLLTNNNVGGFANFLSGSNLLTGVNGGLLRRVGLPENFVVANPQFGVSNLTGNFSSSSYHSLQVELMRRFSSGFTFQGNYTWSRTLGDYDGEDSDLASNYRTLRNRSLDKRLLGYHRAHVWRSNGIYELPFGPGKKFGRGSQGVAAKLIGGWQVGAIFNKFTGSPINFGAANAFNTFGGTTPVVLGALPDKGVQRTGNGVIYFSGYQQVRDPYVARITTEQGIQSRSTLRAIADASGRPTLVNPEPGQFGTLGMQAMEGPGSFRLDVNFIKRVKITERFELHLRADAVNFTNTPQFSNPNTDINSLNFGQITGAGGNRIVVLKLRLNF